MLGMLLSFPSRLPAASLRHHLSQSYTCYLCRVRTAEQGWVLRCCKSVEVPGCLVNVHGCWWQTAWLVEISRTSDRAQCNSMLWHHRVAEASQRNVPRLAAPCNLT